MPISRKDFESGLDSRTKRIVEFLESYSDQAFTAKEIGTKLQIESPEIYDLVNYLHLDAKIIQRNQIAEIYYYSVKEPQKGA